MSNKAKVRKITIKIKIKIKVEIEIEIEIEIASTANEKFVRYYTKLTLIGSFKIHEIH
jgi:hypothetical protein